MDLLTGAEASSCFLDRAPSPDFPVELDSDATADCDRDADECAFLSSSELIVLKNDLVTSFTAILSCRYGTGPHEKS